MEHYGQLFIDGRWVSPECDGVRTLIDPTSEEGWATVTSGGRSSDVDRAVAAAKRAFVSFSKTSVDERIALIDRIIAAYERREADLAQLIAQEVGVPVSMKAQVTGPAGHMKVARDILRSYVFERQLADTIVRREPIGVCALISPWNWPIQTSVTKVIYAIAAGCTMVLKPSDVSPASGVALAEVMEDAGTPAGVFNWSSGGEAWWERRSRATRTLISFHSPVRITRGSPPSAKRLRRPSSGLAWDWSANRRTSF